MTEPAGVREALEWYRDEAEALARHLAKKGAPTDAVIASVAVLGLDGGNRARAALASLDAPPDGVWEALQRLIENGLAAGKASADDAATVARYRKQLLAATAAGDVQALLSPTNADMLLAAGEMTAQELRTVRAVLNWLKGRAAPAVAPQPLTDEQIVDIRDEHLPNQGDRFDCIAFARAILAAAPAVGVQPPNSGIAHGDHGRHWDRTCPACIAEDDPTEAPSTAPQAPAEGERCPFCGYIWTGPGKEVGGPHGPGVCELEPVECEQKRTIEPEATGQDEKS